LVLLGFAMLLIGAFHTDPAGAAPTIEGTIHGLAATVTFWIFPVAILFMSPSLRKDPRWSYIFWYTIVAAVLAVALGITVRVIGHNQGSFGLLERLLVANMIVWVEVAAVKLLLISLKRWSEPVKKSGELVPPPVP
jgi:hypothetical protein